MEFDHLAQQKQEQKAAAWLNLWSSRSPEISSMQLAERYRPGKTVSACLWKSGAFNICYRVRYDEGPGVIVRFAALGCAICRREKVQIEVATIRWIRYTTSIPVPEFFGSRICWVGLYIVMEFLNGVPLSQILRDPSRSFFGGTTGPEPVNKHLDFKRAFCEMALYILELSRYQFNSIGAFKGNKDKDWEEDLNHFLARYLPRLDAFLEVLHNYENRLIEQQILFEPQCLSLRMKNSMETRLFWICLTARYSSMFDKIYWKFIDPQYHGTFTTLDDRISLLSEEQRQEMRELVKLKSDKRVKVYNPKSQEVIIGLIRNSAPTDDQVEKAKEDLKATMAMEETKEKLSEADQALLMAAAQSRRAKRLKNKKEK
ncbi:hypothetical protein N7488_002513 [Penicillium malachiteum]|nr:hypothetical protein N7488_002513 [Penicillium malachiteum]